MYLATDISIIFYLAFYSGLMLNSIHYQKKKHHQLLDGAYYQNSRKLYLNDDEKIS